MDSNIAGSPSARMTTPAICTIVNSRKSQSSVSKAEANHEKLIQAQTSENIAKPKPKPKPMIAGPVWPSAMPWAKRFPAAPNDAANARS